MAKEKANIPSGMAGLTRYSDEEKGVFQIRPGHVILLIIVVILIVLALHMFGNAIFNIPQQ